LIIFVNLIKIAMKYLLPALIFCLCACGPTDPKMCDCLDAGDKLNQFSSKLLSKEATPKEVAEMKKLKADKTSKCKDYQTMSGEEMLKRKAECGE